MVIFRKYVTSVGNAGHVLLPSDLVGSEVWIVSRDDIKDLKELIESTLLYRKAFLHDQNEMTKEFNQFKLTTDSRLRRLEMIVNPENKP